MLIIFVVILLDLIGFGIMVPILAYFVVQLGGGPTLATACMALYAVGMFIASPVLGRISDYYGRKPVLVVSMAGAVLGYILLGLAETIWLIALSRLLSGFMAGNLAAAQAYITDITSEANRAKGMGLIGAAFGLGFIIGPVLGTWLAGDDFATANLRLPAMVSAGMSALALAVIVFVLPESLDESHRKALRAQPRLGQWQAFRKAASNGLVLPFLQGTLIYNMGAGLVESILPLWVKDTGIAAGPRDLMPLLFVAGVIMAVVQGGLIGPLTRRFGEQRLLVSGALGFSLSTLVMMTAGNLGLYYGVMLALCLQTVSAALVLTSMQSLVSMTAGPHERGLVMGAYSAAGTLGRVIGTLLTGAVFAYLHIHSSFALAGCLALCLMLLSAKKLKHPNAAAV